MSRIAQIHTLGGAGYQQYAGRAVQGYSFIASIAAIFIMMKWLKNYTFLPFVIYRVGLGIFLLLHSYGYI